MSFSFPVVGTSLHEQADTYGAGRSGGRSHKGIDIFAPNGAAVVAVRGGTIVKAGDSGGLGGIRAWVRDDDGFFHYYAHLSSLDVQVGQRVEAGQKLGGVGNTGLEARNTPPHLHYSVNNQGHTSESGGINPFEYLRTNGATVASGFTQAEDSFTAAARREQRSEAGLPELGKDPGQEFVESRRASSDTMASIMAFISERSSRSGGKILDTKALFGDVFGADEGEPDVHDHDVEGEVA